MVEAYGFLKHGDPDVLERVTVPREALGPTEVRIRVAAAAVNPTDALLRSGARATTSPPSGVSVTGMDVAGQVTEVGDAVSNLAVGDRVMAIVVPREEHGGYRRDIVLPNASVVHAPSGATFAEAASLPMNALTARLAIDTLALPAGSTIAVTGAAGAFGGYVVQLATAEGYRVVADASCADKELVTELGADVVLLRGTGFAERVRARFPHGVDGLADGALLGPDAVPALRTDGAMVTVRGYKAEDIDVGRLRVQPIYVFTVAERADLLERLRAQVDAGQLAMRVAEVLPAAEAPEAHRRLARGGLRGRIVLDLGGAEE